MFHRQFSRPIPLHPCACRRLPARYLSNSVKRHAASRVFRYGPSDAVPGGCESLSSVTRWSLAFARSDDVRAATLAKKNSQLSTRRRVVHPPVPEKPPRRPRSNPVGALVSGAAGEHPKTYRTGSMVDAPNALLLHRRIEACRRMRGNFLRLGI